MRSVHFTDSPRSAQAAKWQNWVTLCAGIVEFILALIPGMVSRKALGIVMGILLIGGAIWALTGAHRTSNLVTLTVLAVAMIILGLIPHCLGTTGWLIGVIVIALIGLHVYELTHPLRAEMGTTAQSAAKK